MSTQADPCTCRSCSPRSEAAEGGWGSAPTFRWSRQQYWIFGSATATWPETPLGPVTIPLVPDPYTDITIALPNSALLSGFRGILDGNGQGSASFNIPTGAPAAAVGLTIYHSYIIYDFSRAIRGVSNAAPIQFIK